MAVKLVLNNNDEFEEYTFEQDRISLGRDKDNDLHIPDTSRVVSKRHAEIVCIDNAYEIADLGSKNFTYLNNARLESGRSYTLKSGDLIKLGEYELTFVLPTPESELDTELEPELEEAPPRRDYDKTVFESSFINPFAEDATRLVAALKNICTSFENEAPNRRVDALRDAFSGLNLHATHEAQHLVLSILAYEPDGEATDPVIRTSSRASKNGEEKPAVALSDRSVPPEKALARVSQRLPVESSEQQGRVLQVVLNVLSMLLSIPWEFRHEFVGHTIAQTPESEILFEGNGQKLGKYLLDVSLDEDELTQRLALIEEGGDEVILHQLAMLEGYKAVVQQGMHMLLREIDPIVAAESLAQQSGPYRMVPNLARMVASWKLQEKFKELRAEDWSVTERRAYRPSFIRAYLSRMSAGPKKTPLSG